jgi:hypothetical protein
MRDAEHRPDRVIDKVHGELAGKMLRGAAKARVAEERRGLQNGRGGGDDRPSRRGADERCDSSQTAPVHRRSSQRRVDMM